MAQNPTANQFTFTDESGNIRLTYYPHAPGPLIAGQPSGGPRLVYEGPEGSLVFPDAAGTGREHIHVLQEGPLGSLVNVALAPTADTPAATLTLLLPPIDLAGKDAQDFETIAIKTTSGKLPGEGALLTYEVIPLHGTARHVLLPRTASPSAESNATHNP